MRLAIVLNASWNIVNFRLGLLKALERDGHKILVIAPRDEYTSRIPFAFVELTMSRRGRNPFAEAGIFVRLLLIYRRYRPDVVLHFTPKPNLYGSLAAFLLGIPAISNVAGLGSVFSGGGWMKPLLKVLYGISFRSNRKVFFQNEEDKAFFLRQGLVRASQALRIPGSGIDLDRFRPVQKKEDLVDVRFLLVSRLLWEKGIGDYVEAARLLRVRGMPVRFQLLGFLEEGNPASVGRDKVDEWTSKGWIEYLGVSDDVRCELSQIDCVVMPSTYGEGVPRTLLEAAAMGKPIVAYDNVGVRDVVRDGWNGFLVPINDVQALATALGEIVEMGPEARVRLGRNGRTKVEKEFDEGLVIEAYRSELDRVSLGDWAPVPDSSG